MKINRNISKVIYLTIAFISGLAILINPCFSKEAKKVAVLPFIMNAQEDLTFLQKGIFDMFSSRVSYGDEVEVLTRENLEDMLKNAVPPFSITRGVNESKAKELGKYLNVDYVLFGSLTIFGNSMSLDVNMVDIKNNIPALTFFRQAKEAGAVIPELDKISEEINYKVFGRETETFQNKNIAQKYYEGSKEGYVSPLQKFQTLYAINDEIEGMSVGDVDGDNKKEIVITYGHIIEILKFNINGRLQPVSKIEMNYALTIVAIDVADINQNGYAEIFVSSMNRMSQKVRSSVIEYNGKNYIKGSVSYPWYFRVIDNAGHQTLFAQKSGKGGPYTSQKVFKVQATGKQYAVERHLNIPDGFSIMGFAKGKIFKDNIADRVFTNKDGRLMIFNESGRVEWSGEKGYGGSVLFFPFKRAKASDEDYEGEYFQPRSLIYDVDGDGSPNLVVIKNNNPTGGAFKGFRQYNYGLIEVMEWNELGLSPVNAPKKIPGQITDINIADIDQDSKDELLVSFVKQRKKFFSNDPKSIIIAYALK